MKSTNTVRRLAIRLYWMWREGRDYEQQKSSVRTQDSPDIAMVCTKRREIDWASCSLRREMALLLECTSKHAPNLFDNADIVRDAMLRLLTLLPVGEKKFGLLGSHAKAITFKTTSV